MQVVAFSVYLMGFMLVPSTSRSVAAYLEFTGSKAYALAMRDMEAVGMLTSLGGQLVPWATCVLCELEVPLYSSSSRDESPSLSAAWTKPPLVLTSSVEVTKDGPFALEWWHAFLFHLIKQAVIGCMPCY